VSLFRKIFGRYTLPKDLDGCTDYASIDSLDKVLALVAIGVLVPWHPFT